MSMNKKIRIVKGTARNAAQKKHALGIGDVPAVVLENFETLTQPPFKPRLELIEADPHTPPDMNTSTDQNIDTDGEDSKRPSTEDLVRKGPDYENGSTIEKEKVPHENEHVKQGRKTAEEDNRPDFLKEKDEEGSEEESDDTVEARLKEHQRRYAQNFTLASRLFDIKLAAGIEQEINRYEFVHRTAESARSEDLEAQIENDGKMLERIQASQPQQKVASAPILPAGFHSQTRTKDTPFESDLEAIILGG